MDKCEIVRQDDYLGVRYWKRVVKVGKPLFQVYEYLGSCPDHITFFFRKYKGPDILVRTFSELNTDEFSPFLLNFEKISKALDAIKK